MEYIKTNGAEYACKAVVTGVDSISFSMEGQAVACLLYTSYRMTLKGKEKHNSRYHVVTEF